GLEAAHDVRGLLRVRSGTDLQVDVGRGHPQLLKKHVGHVEIVVLARMDNNLLHGIRGERADHRRGLHEIRPGSYDMNDLHLFSIPEGYFLKISCKHIQCRGTEACIVLPIAASRYAGTGFCPLRTKRRPGEGKTFGLPNRNLPRHAHPAFWSEDSGNRSGSAWPCQTCP